MFFVNLVALANFHKIATYTIWYAMNFDIKLINDMSAVQMADSSHQGHQCSCQFFRNLLRNWQKRANFKFAIAAKPFGSPPRKLLINYSQGNVNFFNLWHWQFNCQLSSDTLDFFTNLPLLTGMWHVNVICSSSFVILHSAINIDSLHH